MTSSARAKVTFLVGVRLAIVSCETEPRLFFFELLLDMPESKTLLLFYLPLDPLEYLGYQEVIENSCLVCIWSTLEICVVHAK